MKKADSDNSEKKQTRQKEKQKVKKQLSDALRKNLMRRKNLEPALKNI